MKQDRLMGGASLTAIPVVIDTEIGNNIDDAFAIALACVSKEIELLGVTTTYFEAESRVQLARRLLASYGRPEIPVVPGRSSRWLGQNPEPDFFTQRRFCSNDGLPPNPGRGDALPWLRELLKIRKGITFIANAPLTNLAELITTHPELASSIDKVVLMGGWSSQALHEWNIMQHPQAVQTVLESGIPTIFIGLDVTLGCILTEEFLKSYRESVVRGTQLLMELCDCYIRASHISEPVLHDPLTLAFLIDPALMKLADATVKVDLEPGAGYGVLLKEKTGGYPVRVATEVDRRRYLELLSSRLAGASDKPSEARQSSLPVFLQMIDALEVAYYPGWHMESSSSSNHTLAYIVRGDCTVKSEEYSAVVRVSQGELLYLAPDISYGLSTADGMTMRLIHYKAVPEKPMFSLVPSVDGPAVESLVHRVVAAWKNPADRGQLRCISLLYELVFEMTRDEVSDHLSEGRKIVNRAKMIIEAKAEENIALDEICDIVGTSRQTLIRFFKLYEKQTPMSYHHYLRIRRARALLELGHLQVKEIALRLGFSSVQVFSRSFKNEVGIGPGQYQKKVRNLP